MLTHEQLREFHERGVLWQRGAVDPAAVAGLRERVLAFLAERRVVPESPPPGFVVRPSVTARVMRQLEFAKTWGDDVLAAIDDLVGPGAWQPPAYAGQLLAIHHPEAGAAWKLPHQVWHLDYTAPASAARMPGVQPFLCVDRVEPRGGGTLLASGTHRLVDALRSKRGPDWPGASAAVRKSLARDVPWLGALLSLRPGEDRIARFMGQATVWGGVPLQVLEVVGEPGDVVFMHPWLLHAPSQNCGARPRMVLTERVRSRG